MEEDHGWMKTTDPGFGSFIRNVISVRDDDVQSGVVKLQRHQKAIRTFLKDTPYRGILAYHGLGSGKTCAAIAAAEALSSTKDRVIVFLPASLISNFKSELIKCGPDIDIDRVHFVTTNGVNPDKINTKTSTIDGLSLHKSTLIVDEVHNLANQVRNKGARGMKLYDAIFNARDSKIICLSGTIIVNSPFELAIIINMVSGPVRSIVFHKFLEKTDNITNYLEDNTRVLSHSIQGSKVVVFPCQEGYRRKSPKSQLLVRHKSEDPDLTLEPFKVISDQIKKEIKASYYSKKENTVFPIQEEDFERIFSDSGRLKNTSAFQSAALGTVSHFSLTKAEARAKGFPDVLPENVVFLEMSDVMYERYLELRNAEIEMEDSAVKKKKRTGIDDSGNFKSMSRMVCNFAFLKKTDRIFKSMMDKSGSDKSYEDINETALDKLRQNDMDTLKGDSLKRHSPKMAAILDKLESDDGPALVYSNYRNMEGVGIFSMVLEAAGYSRLIVDENGNIDANSDPKKRVFYEFEGASETGHSIDVFNGNNSGWNKRRPKGFPPVDVILITQAGAEGISLKGVRQVHIMEPHWNEIRIQQVIGRAARLESHSHLPVQDRNVSVYRYIMLLGDEKSGDDKKVRKRDKGKTTDQIVFDTAVHKAALSESFLSALKSVAVDCGLYPESVDCNLTPNKKVRSRSSARLGSQEVEPKKQPKPLYELVERNGVLYIKDPATNEYLSYDAYKKTGKRVVVTF
ncbi:DEAD/SNF2-like helicase [Tetraselmis virus 1]|uniref:DEAD/SNF2-like helicase n=1 Tax=Tetraselmis virus 1 TaxID=2060617 RepID=A0A2P0VN48_9VIRU|nr:DEAD/SNF2-like helicase [Tetraselmis virus 1]AUF82300.1 DEAD/SNF2-like helicase [Tetraselmis virus 1]